MTIHEKQRRRSRCTVWTQTCSERRGTLFFGLRKPIELIVIVVTLVADGCPVQAMVQACGRDERTAADWRDRAGERCQRLHEAIVEQGRLDGMAMMVSTRLWLAGTVSVRRDKALADALPHQGRRTTLKRRLLLMVTNGWAASPGSLCRAFREKATRTLGPSRACVQVWPSLHSGTTITRTEKKRVVDITRTMARGLVESAEYLLTRFGEANTSLPRVSNA
jgi:hypothetical protein